MITGFCDSLYGNARLHLSNFPITFKLIYLCVCVRVLTRVTQIINAARRTLYFCTMILTQILNICPGHFLREFTPPLLRICSPKINPQTIFPGCQLSVIGEGLLADCLCRFSSLVHNYDKQLAATRESCDEILRRLKFTRYALGHSKARLSVVRKHIDNE